jgi:hypothetical protein
MVKNWWMIGVFVLVCELFALGWMKERQMLFDRELVCCLETADQLVRINQIVQNKSSRNIDKVCYTYKNDLTSLAREQMNCVLEAKGKRTELSHLDAVTLIDTCELFAPELKSAFIAYRTRLGAISELENAARLPNNKTAALKLRMLCIEQALVTTLSRMEDRIPNMKLIGLQRGFFQVTPRKIIIAAKESWDAEVRLAHHQGMVNNCTYEVNGIPCPSPKGRATGKFVWRGGKDVLKVAVIVRNPLTGQVIAYRKQLKIPTI